MNGAPPARGPVHLQNTIKVLFYKGFTASDPLKRLLYYAYP